MGPTFKRYHTGLRPLTDIPRLFNCRGQAIELSAAHLGFTQANARSITSGVSANFSGGSTAPMRKIERWRKVPKP